MNLGLPPTGPGAIPLGADAKKLHWGGGGLATLGNGPRGRHGPLHGWAMGARPWIVSQIVVTFSVVATLLQRSY